MADYAGEAFQVRLWNGATWGQTHCPKFRLMINNPEGLRRLFVNPSELGIGEAYIAGDFDVEGDMAAAFEIGDYLLDEAKTSGISQLLLALLGKMPSHEEATNGLQPAQLHGPIHSKNRDLRAIRYHYDLPPEFFALWLDRRMIYSGAYFADADNTDLDAHNFPNCNISPGSSGCSPASTCSISVVDGEVSWPRRQRNMALMFNGVTLSLRQA